ncbi:gamma-glutamyl-gamma-aminobutyrate hydrolase family protein [Oleidesulfovibrio alaskensis]|uniref:gamma-glutamyl-gamma-aminobutyrate hydrolase family protein n=1 Tax=Oleidesulfovibrio alaskensis TaxID=58180 RepID=UPI000406BC3B|nr:gamma-glutamyl-gamma-aminobutyrate hydrolase family protein [Oleidesulfovibrio alaskensis]
MTVQTVLIAISQRVEHVAGRAEVRDCLDRSWSLFMDRCGCALFPVPSHTADVGAALDAAGVSGVILSGGNSLSCTGAPDADMVRDRLEAGLIGYAQARGLPVAGVCRGMQMLCRHLSGVVPVPVTGHAGTRHALLCSPQALRHGIHRTEVASYHDYGIPSAALAGHFHVLAQSQDGMAEAVLSLCGGMLGIMWHPERGQPFDEGDVELFSNLFNAGGVR